MVIKINYTCDKCGNVQETENQFWTLGIFATCGYSNPYELKCTVENKSIHVCRPCLESFGIYSVIKLGEPVNDETIESLIRRILELVQ